jgi:hypothetical protein
MQRNPSLCPHCGKRINMQSREEAKADRVNAFAMWTSADDRKLNELYQSGSTNFEISQIMERQVGGINRRIEKLQLWRSPEAAAKAEHVVTALAEEPPTARARPETAAEAHDRHADEEIERWGLQDDAAKATVRYSDSLGFGA